MNRKFEGSTFILFIEITNICNIINIFTLTFDQFDVSLLNKIIIIIIYLFI